MNDHKVDCTPLVSLIVPCYNYGRFLRDALESVLRQTYACWECIIIDDGSRDDTKEIAGQFTASDNRFKYIYQQNAGLSEARNTGLKAAKGDYIQLLDADDMLEPQKLELQVSFLEEHPEYDLIYSDAALFTDGEATAQEPFQFSVQRVTGQGNALLSAIVHDNFFLPGCPLFRKSLSAETGTFDRSLKALEDWHYWFRAALLGKAFYYDQRPGTRLLSRSHGLNMSAERLRMWIARTKARRMVMEVTDEYLRKGRLQLSGEEQEKLRALHIHLLHRDEARYHMHFGNCLSGLGHMVRHAWHSKNPFYAVYDGAYWLKERLKKVSR
jgi:glycosyltransferase involved in cell wall biosynthesis